MILSFKFMQKRGLHKSIKGKNHAKTRLSKDYF